MVAVRRFGARREDGFTQLLGELKPRGKLDAGVPGRLLHEIFATDQLGQPEHGPTSPAIL